MKDIVHFYLVPNYDEDAHFRRFFPPSIEPEDWMTACSCCGCWIFAEAGESLLYQGHSSAIADHVTIHAQHGGHFVTMGMKAVLREVVKAKTLKLMQNLERKRQAATSS